jgi:hypothetical protein
MKYWMILLSACLLQGCFLFSDDDSFDSGSKADLSDKETATKVAIALAEYLELPGLDGPSATSREADSKADAETKASSEASSSESFDFICVEDSNDEVGSGTGSRSFNSSVSEDDSSFNFSQSRTLNNSFTNCTAGIGKRMSSGNLFVTYNGGGDRSFNDSRSGSTTETEDEVTQVSGFSHSANIKRDLTISYIIEADEPEPLAAPEPRDSVSETADISYTVNVDRSANFERSETRTNPVVKDDIDDRVSPPSESEVVITHSENTRETEVINVIDNDNDHSAEQRVNLTYATNYNQEDEVYEHTIDGSYGFFFENVPSVEPASAKEAEMEPAPELCPSGSVDVDTLAPITSESVDGEFASGSVMLSSGDDSITITYAEGELTITYNDEELDVETALVEYPEVCFPQAPDFRKLPKPRADGGGRPG